MMARLVEFLLDGIFMAMVLGLAVFGTVALGM